MLATACWLAFSGCDGTSSDDSGDGKSPTDSGGDTGSDSGGEGDLVPPPWSDTPFEGDPRTCTWGALLWDDAVDYVVQLRLPYTRDEGSAAQSFSATGSFPADSELVIAAFSSVKEEAGLAEGEGCEFETEVPSDYSDPGVWWFATSGEVEVEATYVGVGGEHEECEPDQNYTISVRLSGVLVESDSGEAAEIRDVSWTDLDVRFLGCPPE